MERRLATASGAAIVIAGTLLHFVYGWSGRNPLIGLVSPVSESVWEHTKLLVVPVVVAGAVEAVLLHDVRRVVWATLVEAILGALAIVAIFYTYTGALGTGPILWVDITSFVLVVAGGQWLYLRVLLSNQITVPPAVVSVLGLLALLVLHAICDAARPACLPARLKPPGCVPGPVHVASRFDLPGRSTGSQPTAPRYARRWRR